MYAAIIRQLFPLPDETSQHEHFKLLADKQGPCRYHVGSFSVAAHSLSCHANNRRCLRQAQTAQTYEGSRPPLPSRVLRLDTYLGLFSRPYKCEYYCNMHLHPTCLGSFASKKI
jgi:hypothetical protein